MNRQYLMLTMLILLLVPATGQGTRVLTIDSCRNLAVANNKGLRQAEMMMAEAACNHKSAVTSYLPKVSASAMYIHSGKELSLLSDRQKSTLSMLGDALSIPELNSVGQGLVDALRTDTRNMGGAVVTLTQPLYMGGRIRAYDRITRYAEKIAADRRNLKLQEVVVAVDETYWNIVELSARKRLAESYLNLVETLCHDVGRMIEAGVATRADGLSVKVKENEARVAIIQVDNSIEILKMRMCQLCGLPLDMPLELADEGGESLGREGSVGMAGMEGDAWKSRPELNALETSVKVYEEKVRIARAEYLPTVALTGGYMAGYPSVFNSFEKKFKGMWNVGIAVNIPILTWGDRVYKERAAKARALASRLELEETREKIELQVSQSRQKVREAQERYAASASSQAAAEENLRYATLGLREGVLPVSNVIEAQTAWLSAKTGLISSEIEMRLADLYLRKSLGTIE